MTCGEVGCSACPYCRDWNILQCVTTTQCWSIAGGRGRAGGWGREACVLLTLIPHCAQCGGCTGPCGEERGQLSAHSHQGGQRGVPGAHHTPAPPPPVLTSPPPSAPQGCPLQAPHQCEWTWCITALWAHGSAPGHTPSSSRAILTHLSGCWLKQELTSVHCTGERYGLACWE